MNDKPKLQATPKTLVLALALATASGAFAAEAGSTTGEAKELSSVTVTARRGTELAKEVPFAISVVGGDELESRRLFSMEEALRSVPGVDINSWGGVNDANIRIRGVGSLYQVSADDSSVVVNVDGVPLSARNASLGTLDVERVEVLKGPQGTLFGRNSEAGAVNVTTRRPTRHVEGYVRGELGEQGQHLEEAVISGPLSEKFSGRFAVRNSGTDNWVDNLQTGGPVSKPKDLAYRGGLLWDIQRGTSAFLSSERQEIRGKVGLMVLRPYGDNPINDVSAGSFDDNKKTIERHSLEINHDFSLGRLTSLTSGTSTSLYSVAGADRTVALPWQGAADPVMKTETGDEDAFNQDLRLSSLPGSPIFWVAGLNLYRADRTFNTDMPAYTAFFGAYSKDRTLQERSFRTESEALYGELTYPLTPRLKVTAGLRHTWEEKRFDARYDNGADNFGGPHTVSFDHRDLEDNYSTGRVALSYALSAATNVYAVLARGYKAGGFNDNATQVADGTPYKAAVADNLEFGFKTESVEQGLVLNGAVFLNRIKDDHLLSYNPGNNFASTAVNADTETKGFELEGRWRLGGGFTLSGGVSHIVGKVVGDVAIDPSAGGNVNAGNHLPDVPKWSWNAGVDYQRALESSLLGLSAPVFNAKLNYRYVGARAADAQNHFELEKYAKVDMRIGLISGNTEVYLWGDNLLDKRYDLYGYYMQSNVGGAPFTIGMPSRGRSFGVGASLSF